MMNYKLSDLQQAALGCMGGIFGLILFFVFGTSPDGAVISPYLGIMITLAFLSLTYISVKKYVPRGALIHLVIDYILALVLAVGASWIFKVITPDLLFSFDFFGTVPIIVSWIIFIPGLIFDIKEFATFIDDDLGTYYIDRLTNRYSNSLGYYCNSKYTKKEEISKCMNGDSS